MKAKYAGNLLAGLALVAGLAMSAGAQATTIDFSGLAVGTMVTNQYPGVVFSLQGGPFSGGAPYINTFYDGTGLPNSALPDYPTANILDIAFSMPVSGVSFTFTNYLSGQGSPAPTTFTAFNASNAVVDTGSLQFVDPGSSFAPISVSGSGITDLQLNNNVGPDNWYFAIQELTFTPGTTSATPLPAALPLFATGLGGLGLLGWRRKRKSQAVAFGTLALLATVCVPNCASAATLGPEPFTVSIPPDTPVFLENILDTSAFNQFNPSLGMLTGLTATIGGNVDWQVNFLPFNPIFDTLTVTFITPGVTGSSQMQTASSAPSTVPVMVNLTNTLSSPNPFLADYEGTGKIFLQVAFDDVVPSGNFISSTDGLSGSITYTYTPAATPLPAALPLFATGLGAIGLLGWRRKRKAQAV